MQRRRKGAGPCGFARNALRRGGCRRHTKPDSRQGIHFPHDFLPIAATMTAGGYRFFTRI